MSTKIKRDRRQLQEAQAGGANGHLPHRQHEGTSTRDTATSGEEPPPHGAPQLTLPSAGRGTLLVGAYTAFISMGMGSLILGASYLTLPKARNLDTGSTRLWQHTILPSVQATGVLLGILLTLLLRLCSPCLLSCTAVVSGVTVVASPWCSYWPLLAGDVFINGAALGLAIAVFSTICHSVYGRQRSVVFLLAIHLFLSIGAILVPVLVQPFVQHQSPIASDGIRTDGSLEQPWGTQDGFMDVSEIFDRMLYDDEDDLSDGGTLAINDDGSYNNTRLVHQHDWLPDPPPPRSEWENLEGDPPQVDEDLIWMHNAVRNQQLVVGGEDEGGGRGMYEAEEREQQEEEARGAGAHIITPTYTHWHQIWTLDKDTLYLLTCVFDLVSAVILSVSSVLLRHHITALRHQVDLTYDTNCDVIERRHHDSDVTLDECDAIDEHYVSKTSSLRVHYDEKLHHQHTQLQDAVHHTYTPTLNDPKGAPYLSTTLHPSPNPSQTPHTPYITCTVLFIIAIMSLCYSGLSTTCGQLLPLLVIRNYQWTYAQTTLLCVCYWTAYALGCVTACIAATYKASRKVLVCGSVVLVAGSMLLVIGVPYHTATLWLCVVLLGVGCATTLPNCLCVALHVLPKNVVSIMSTVLVSSCFGSMLLPLLCGMLMTGYTQSYGYILLGVCVLATVLLCVVYVGYMQPYISAHKHTSHHAAPPNNDHSSPHPPHLYSRSPTHPLHSVYNSFTLVSVNDNNKSTATTSNNSNNNEPDNNMLQLYNTAMHCGCPTAVAGDDVTRERSTSQSTDQSQETALTDDSRVSITIDESAHDESPPADDSLPPDADGEGGDDTDAAAALPLVLSHRCNCTPSCSCSCTASDEASLAPDDSCSTETGSDQLLLHHHHHHLPSASA